MIKILTTTAIVIISLLTISCGSANQAAPTMDESASEEIIQAPNPVLSSFTGPENAHRNPPTPSQEELIKLCTHDLNALRRELHTADNGENEYYYNDTLFEGWACLEDTTTNHRYRYSQFLGGQLKWQITFFKDGSLSSDFHQFDENGNGSERMWMDDGRPYIERYQSSPGVMHDIQRRWYTNGKLALEAKWEHGTMLYKLEYDTNGSLLVLEGDTSLQVKN